MTSCLTKHPGGSFRDGYRGLSSTQPDLPAAPARGIMEIGKGHGNSPAAGEIAAPDISAQWAWCQWLKGRMA